MPHHTMNHAGSAVSDEMRECINNCTECHQICVETVKYCLDRHAEPGHIGLLLDCAEICQTSANFTVRQSPFHSYTCAACAEVCERCAASCDEMGDDAQMRACADMCRKCAESCRRMAGQTRG
jgi:hypothetical protein